MFIRKFIEILLSVLIIIYSINSYFFIYKPEWFYILYSGKFISVESRLVDSFYFVTSILSTTGTTLIPLTNAAKLWTSVIQLIPYILIPIFIAST